MSTRHSAFRGAVSWRARPLSASLLLFTLCLPLLPHSLLPLPFLLPLLVFLHSLPLEEGKASRPTISTRHTVTYLHTHTQSHFQGKKQLSFSMCLGSCCTDCMFIYTIIYECLSTKSLPHRQLLAGSVWGHTERGRLLREDRLGHEHGTYCTLHM